MSKDIDFNVRDDFSEKMNIFTYFTYNTLASGALILEGIFFADYQYHGPL